MSVSEKNQISEHLDDWAFLMLAWRIWSAGGGSVPAEDLAMRDKLMPAIRDGVVLEDDKGLRFASELSMVWAAAQYIVHVEAPLLTSTPKACFERLDELFGKEIDKKHRVSAHVLALLHNDGQLDSYSWGRQAIEAGIGVFAVLHVLEGAVVHFENVCGKSVLQFFVSHYESVRDDFARGLVYPELRAWFARHPDIALEVKGLHEEHPEESSASLYSCTLHGLILSDFQYGFALAAASGKSTDRLIAGPAIYVLGLADYSDPSRRLALDETVKRCAEILQTPEHPLLGTAVKTLSRLITLDENGIAHLINEAGKTAAPEALYALSEFLWREEKSIRKKDWFWSLILHLTSAKTKHKGILQNVDVMLMKWVRDPVQQPRVIEFMEMWISKQSREALKEEGLEGYFSSTVHRLVQQPATLNHALTRWLLHDDDRYPLVVQKWVSRLRPKSANSLELESTIIDKLNRDEMRFLLRRILGYIIGDEAQIRLVFSLTRTVSAKARSFGYVASVLRDQVGYDYPYQTIEYLKERQCADNEAEEVKALCSEIVSELQGQLDVLDALPGLKEFHPSSVKTRQFCKGRRRQMNEAFEEASKDSIWRQIAAHISLKAGQRTFQTIEGRYTDPMELKGMSHSMALPRSEVSDPAGAARERLLYRRAKKDWT